MEDQFTIPVTFHGTAFNFPARLLHYGYSYRLEIEIEDTMVLFEPDEERNWRALVSYEDIKVNKKLNPDLLKKS
jgi:hypothetical protein